MRADAHYVDQLDAPTSIAVQLIAIGAVEAADEAPAAVPALVDSIKRHGVLEPLIVQKRDRRYRVIAGRKRLSAATAAGLREVPCIVRRVGDEEAQMLAAAARLPMTAVTAPSAPTLGALDSDIAQSLAAVLSSTALLEDGTLRLARSVTLDLIRAEAHRALCTLRVVGVLRRGINADRALVSPRDLVHRVADIVGADARLRRVRVTADATGTSGAMLYVDPTLVATGFSAVVLTLSAAVNRADDSALSLTASLEPAGCVTIAAEYDFVVVPDAWLTPSSAPALDAPGGQQLVPLEALRHIAEAYGGRLSIRRLPHGSRVALELKLFGR